MAATGLLNDENIADTEIRDIKPEISQTTLVTDSDPEKKKCPSKRRYIIKPNRNPACDYRQRLAYFDSKQKGAKEDVTAFIEVALEGANMVPDVLDGTYHVQELFPKYKYAFSKYQEACLKLRQTILAERKLAAEIWGDNNIASFKEGVYVVDRNALEELVSPKLPEYPHCSSNSIAIKKIQRNKSVRKYSPY